MRSQLALQGQLGLIGSRLPAAEWQPRIVESPLSKDERRRLFEEYHMEREVKEHHPIVHSDGGKRELRKQTRYRDGKVASTTGERFLVEPKESAEFVKATSVSIRVTGGGRTH